MRIARVTGTITATVKDGRLSGVPLVVVDIQDGAGAVLETGVVAADTCSAGPGDMVLVTTGSAARLPANVAGMPVDATIIAIIDHLDVAGKKPAKSSPNKRKS